jgi:Fe2+ transport system protein FeoA
MKLLSDVEAEERVSVKKIEGGKEVIDHLEDLGIRKGVDLKILAQTPTHEHRGAIRLLAAEKEVIIGQGVAEKIYMEKEGAMVSLLEMEKGDKGVVKALKGGKEFTSWVTDLGINLGVEIDFLAHASDHTLVFETGGKTVKVGEGLASRAIAEYGGKTGQINYMKEGESGKVKRITNEFSAREKLGDLGIKEGADITLSTIETVSPTPIKGRYTKARIGDEVITIGHGVAEKVWVE